MSPESKQVFTALKKHGLLLLNDANLPSVCGLVAGERVRGSWWAHPRAQEIFDLDNALSDHRDVLVTKLVSGKVTYIHRSLWPPVVALGRAREPWQLKGLSPEARRLLAAVARAPVEPGRPLTKAAAELEARLLVYSMQYHSESGVHVRRLESWDRWSSRSGASQNSIAAADARASLEEVITSLNCEFNGRGRLPWQGKLA